MEQAEGKVDAWHRQLEAIRKAVEVELPSYGIVLMVCTGNGNFTFSANVNADIMLIYIKSALKFLTEKSSARLG
jgi:hypothetical protein